MNLTSIVSACDFSQLEICHTGDIYVFTLFAGVYKGADGEDCTDGCSLRCTEVVIRAWPFRVKVGCETVSMWIVTHMTICIVHFILVAACSSQLHSWFDCVTPCK